MVGYARRGRDAWDGVAGVVDTVLAATRTGARTRLGDVLVRLVAAVNRERLLQAVCNEYILDLRVNVKCCCEERLGEEVADVRGLVGGCWAAADLVCYRDDRTRSLGCYMYNAAGDRHST